MSGEIDCSTIGPIVTGSTKWPSPTSKWNTLQPARRSTSICSPRREKSAPYSDGSTSTVRIHSDQGTTCGGSSHGQTTPDVLEHGGRLRPERCLATPVEHSGGEDPRPGRRLVVGHLRGEARPERVRDLGEH